MLSAKLIRQSKKSLLSHVGAGLFLILTACVAMPSIASAQEKKGRVITLEDAKRIAARKSISVRMAENDVEAQSASVTAEWGDFAPNLNLSLSPSQTYGTSFGQATGELNRQQVRRVSGRARAELTLFNGFANFASLDAAQHGLSATGRALSRTRRDVVFETTRRFLNFLKNREQVTVQRENLEARKKQLRKIEGLEEVGRKPISDIYQQQANVAEAERALLEAW